MRSSACCCIHLWYCTLYSTIVALRVSVAAVRTIQKLSGQSKNSKDNPKTVRRIQKQQRILLKFLFDWYKNPHLETCLEIMFWPFHREEVWYGCCVTSCGRTSFPPPHHQREVLLMFIVSSWKPFHCKNLTPCLRKDKLLWNTCHQQPLKGNLLENQKG